MSDGNDKGKIDVLLATEQTFEPPPEFAAQANASDPAIYERANEDPEAWWGSWAEKLEWIEPWDEILDWSEPPFAKWFTGGKLNVSANCLDRHVAAGDGDRVAYFWEGEDGTKREITYGWLLEETQKIANGMKSLGIGKGDVVGHLHADGPRGRRRDARLHPDRRDPQRRLRRLQRQLGRRADGGLRRQGPDHGRRDDAARPADADEVGRRRDHRPAAGAGARDRRQPRRHRPADDRRPRPLLARPRRCRRRRVRAGADGLRGPALHPLHVGLDRGAEGDPAHDRRLPDRRQRHPQARLRPQGRRRLLVRGRHRLGHRPQLHRLRAAGQRRHERHVRGRSQLPGRGPLVGDRRALRRHDHVHGADRDPRLHEVGRRAPREARPLHASPARLGRRADQPARLALVLGGDRRRPLPGRRHLVADRDRRDHDRAAARADDDEARLGDDRRSPGSRRRSTTTTATRSRREPAPWS